MREEDIVTGLDTVAAADPKIAAALQRAGYPGPRLRERGYRTMLRTIVGQQVSVAAAGLAKILALPERPSEKATRELAEAWRPHRGAVAILTWHCYNNPAL